MIEQTIRAQVAAEVEAWMKAWRDGCETGSTAWLAMEVMLDDMRLHHQAGVPLDRHVCESAGCGDCAGGSTEELPLDGALWRVVSGKMISYAHGVSQDAIGKALCRDSAFDEADLACYEERGAAMVAAATVTVAPGEVGR